MAPSMAAAAERTHANSRSAELDQIRAGSSMARIATNQAATDDIDTRGIVLDLMGELHLTQKAMAIQAGCPASDLSNALAGKQRLEMDWVLNQEPIFVAMFLERVERAMGFTERSTRELKAARISELVRLLLEVA